MSARSTSRANARPMSSCASARDGVGCVKVDRRIQTAHGIRFSISGGEGEIARAYLYVMRNDLHDAPFGLLEDVYVDESQRGGGLATRLVQEVIAAAREAGCYKLIATSRTSRPKVHELYQRLGLESNGVESRKKWSFPRVCAVTESERRSCNAQSRKPSPAGATARGSTPMNSRRERSTSGLDMSYSQSCRTTRQVLQEPS